MEVGLSPPEVPCPTECPLNAPTKLLREQGGFPAGHWADVLARPAVGVQVLVGPACGSLWLRTHRPTADVDSPPAAAGAVSGYSAEAFGYVGHFVLASVVCLLGVA